MRSLHLPACFPEPPLTTTDPLFAPKSESRLGSELESELESKAELGLKWKEGTNIGTMVDKVIDQYKR
ncbi:hypothetical protein EVAR_6254_1 [Eumeta japonica]|uniref:Uncharacterized protein n=1 Tax=Eumeta variegata TaxID=151549 RepID=A0A4C1T852_EUMVA|nr:hypothetical protein EVAR_6254_1 [Eumeta japonica]